MARTVADVALLLSAGRPGRALPASLPEAGRRSPRPSSRSWPEPGSPGAPTPAAYRSSPRCASSAVLEGLGCEIVDAFPDLSDAPDVSTLRAVGFELNLGRLYDERAISSRRRSAGTSRSRGGRVRRRRDSHARSRGARRAHAPVHEEVDALALPVCQVTPFDIDVEQPREVAGVEMQSYIEWMRSCSDITVTGCPAISVPAGFTPTAFRSACSWSGATRRPRALRLAYAFEQATRAGERRPWPRVTRPSRERAPP